LTKPSVSCSATARSTRSIGMKRTPTEALRCVARAASS
jgi:hypothetical protein